MHKLEKLKIWEKAVELCVHIYKATEHFPREEIYGLTAQIRRAVISIPSNISEGAGRNSNNEFTHFIGIATGSAYEVQTQVVIAEKLQLIPASLSEQLQEYISEVLKMIYAFKQQLKNNTNNVH
jgi:four helix bundle protein